MCGWSRSLFSHFFLLFTYKNKNRKSYKTMLIVYVCILLVVIQYLFSVFFFLFCSFCFVLLTMSFALQKLLSFRRSYLLIVSHSVCATGVIFRKWAPVLMHSSVLSTFFSMRFNVIGFMLRSLIHLDLSFVHADRYRSISILHADIQLWQQHLLNMLSFLHLIVFTSLSKIRCS